MHVNYTKYGTEYIFCANDAWDQIAYAFHLCLQEQTPSQQEESRRDWLNAEGFYYFPKDAVESVPESVLPSTSDETPSRTKGKRRKKDKGTTKGSREMEMQRLRETNEGDRNEGCHYCGEPLCGRH